MPTACRQVSVRRVWEHTFVSDIRANIDELYRSGLSQRAIANELGIAPATVVYHLRRLATEHVEAVPSPAQPLTALRVSGTRARVAELLDGGMLRIEIARRLGLSKATVSYHARRLDHAIDERCARRYDWEAVQRFYDDGHSVRECIETFGFSSASWFDAVKRGAIIARPAATPIAELLVAGAYRGRYSLKLRLIREGSRRIAASAAG